MALTYSKYLQIDHEALLAKGVFDGALDVDSRLHVDPLLLKKCQIAEFEEGIEKTVKWYLDN